MKLSDKLPEIMSLAQAVGDYWDRELPKRLKDYPFVGEGEDEGPPPPEQAKLKELLSSFPEERLYDLMAAADLGSRGLRAEDLGAYRKRLPREWPAALLLNGLADRAALAEDLADGLEKLAARGMDIDSLAKPLAASTT